MLLLNFIRSLLCRYARPRAGAGVLLVHFQIVLLYQVRGLEQLPSALTRGVMYGVAAGRLLSSEQSIALGMLVAQVAGQVARPVASALVVALGNHLNHFLAERDHAAVFVLHDE